jgi:hypothetical protein
MVFNEDAGFDSIGEISSLEKVNRVLGGGLKESDRARELLFLFGCGGFGRGGVAF